MGASQSQKGPAIASANHTPLPVDQWPYPGPAFQYSFMNVTIEMKFHIGFNFSAGSNLVTSNVDAYYPFLAQHYKDGFKAIAFFKIPGSQQTKGFFSVAALIPYQTVYCRKLAAEAQVTSWQLRIEKSIVYPQRLLTGTIFSRLHAPVTTDVSHFYQIINQNAAAGGRFVCMELTGHAISQGMSAGMTGVYPGMGVDLFFNMPLHPNPAIFTYMAISVPIQIVYRFASVDWICDWMGILTQQLSQGWKLADIFLVNQTVMTGPSTIINSVWFFEREQNKVDDPTPLYEGTFVECYVKIKVGLRGISSDFDISQVCQEMGSRGWKLACFIETPKVKPGMMSAKMAVMLLFQRKIVRPQPGFEAAGMPMENVKPPAY